MNSKVIPITNEKFEGRFSLDICKRVLKAKDKGLTDEKVYQIRDLLYALADIDFKLYMDEKQNQPATIIQLNTDHNETQSYSIHPSINRRAS